MSKTKKINNLSKKITKKNIKKIKKKTIRNRKINKSKKKNMKISNKKNGGGKWRQRLEDALKDPSGMVQKAAAEGIHIGREYDIIYFLDQQIKPSTVIVKNINWRGIILVEESGGNQKREYSIKQFLVLWRGAEEYYESKEREREKEEEEERLNNDAVKKAKENAGIEIKKKIILQIGGAEYSGIIKSINRKVIIIEYDEEKPFPPPPYSGSDSFYRHPSSKGVCKLIPRLEDSSYLLKFEYSKPESRDVVKCFGLIKHKYMDDVNDWVIWLAPTCW
jgi:hypothetical protein